jgi:GAF domain-containing protein
VAAGTAVRPVPAVSPASPRTAAGALAAAVAALAREYDVVGTLSQLCSDCAEVVGASAAGIMLADGAQPLEMMAASSHKAEEIDLYEIQAGQGPCIDAYHTGRSVSSSSAEEIIARWPVFGRRAAAAGFQSVQACPLRWHGSVIGSINVFRPAPGGLGDEQQRVVQAFADIASIAIIHAGLPPARDLRAIARHALAARAVIEQAKGVISAQADLDMPASFDSLRAKARKQGKLLEALAREVVDTAAREPS